MEGCAGGDDGRVQWLAWYEELSAMQEQDLPRTEGTANHDVCLQVDDIDWGSTNI